MEKINNSLQRFETTLLRKADRRTLDAYAKLAEDIYTREDYIAELEETLLHHHFRIIKYRESFELLAKAKRTELQLRSLDKMTRKVKHDE